MIKRAYPLYTVHRRVRTDDITYEFTTLPGSVSSSPLRVRDHSKQFADENWLDLRRLDVIAPIMLERLDIMATKGCDAVEWDNADLPVHQVTLNFKLWCFRSLLADEGCS